MTLPAVCEVLANLLLLLVEGYLLVALTVGMLGSLLEAILW